MRAAQRVLRCGEDWRSAWRGRVARKPRSKGGEEGGTMWSVYSTPMKKRSPKANRHGIQWCVATWSASATVHFKNDASERRVELFFMPPFAAWCLLRLRFAEASPERVAPPPFMTVGDGFKCAKHN